MRYKKPRRGNLQLNMTSMLDIVFQLIIFFILVTNFAAADLPPMEPPQPENSQAQKLEGITTRIVNIVPALSRTGLDQYGNPVEEPTGKASHVMAYDQYFSAPGYTLSEVPERERGKVKSLSVLLDLLQNEKQQEGNEDMMADLRVDRAITYKDVQPVMKTITDARISRVNLVAYVDPNQRED